MDATKLLPCNLFFPFLPSYSVGSLKESIPLSSIIVPDDYAYLAAPPHFSDDHSGHFVPSSIYEEIA